MSRKREKGTERQRETKRAGRLRERQRQRTKND